eukprot:m.16581 g.16581  ORF g.16581 m.16581 type:complete len:60 (+) comp27020_c0_seq2:247-426(+)
MERAFVAKLLAWRSPMENQSKKDAAEVVRVQDLVVRAAAATLRSISPLLTFTLCLCLSL